jgi:predicted small metal-binding protein
VLLEKVENIKSTTSHAKRAQKMHNFPDDLITKISTNHKKKHNKTHNV